MRKIYYLLLMLSLFGTARISAQISVSGGSGLAATYTSFSNAGGLFAALNATAQTGNSIIVSVTSDIMNEGGSISLNAGAWTSINITPSGARIISGTVAGAPMINLNGADNMTINGLNTGGNSLTISNLSTSATTLTSTIRFIGGAVSNTITNCSVLGSSTMAVGTNGGNIMFHTDANTANGNDNNTISNCTIGAAGGNLPSKGIYGNGSTTTTAIGNSGNVINNNNFEDIFAPAVTSAGIYLNDGCNSWSITNNRFYQTATRTWTTGSQHSPIWLIGTTSPSGSQGHTVTGNIIGYASSTQTGVYTLTGSGTGARFVGIFFNGISTGTTSTISNNTIASVSMTGVTASGTGNSTPFTAINLQEGLFVSNSNIIGSQSATGSLTFSTTTTSATDVYGIYNFSSGTWTSNSNSIGGISVTNLAASGTFLVWGLKANTGTTVAWTANTNNIGGTVANSIQLAATGTSSQVMGLQSLNAPASFTSNTIRNLTTNIGTGTTTTASVIGICLTSATPANTLAQNTIFNLSNTNTTAASVVTGIQYTGSAGTNNVTRSYIYGLSVSSTSASAEINGIRVAGGTTTYANNMIALGSGITNAVQLNGINEPSGSGTDVFYHNSIYIGGNPTAGSANSFAFNSLVTTNTRNFRDNIFSNARSNGAATGKNYAVQVGGTAANPSGLTINYNVYNASGTGGVFGRFNSADVATLPAWKTAVGQDANSATGDPQYVNPTAATPDLHINAAVATPVEAAGVVIAAVTDDFDGQTRSGFTPTDIGADAGNFTPLPNCTGTPASSTISGVASVCTGTGTTLSLSTAYTDLGITYQWKSSATPGGPYSITLGTNATQATGNLTATTYYIALISCTNSGQTFTTAEKTITVNALPTVMVSPTSGTYCSPGGTAVTLTASGAVSYTWSPTAGLSPTTGAVVAASPSSTTSYIVTGTDANSCTNTATATITVANAVTISSTTATPSTICSGATSTLSVNAGVANSTYGVAAISSPALLTPGAATVTTLSGAASFPVNTNGTAGDDSYSSAITIPFSFGYFGGSITQLWVSTNGYITFSDPSSIGASAQRTPQTFPSTTAPNNVVAIFWHDMDMRTAGNAKYYTIGTTPNRQMVIEFNAIPTFGTSSLHTGQIILYEASGTVDIVVSASPSATKTLGVENSGGTLGVTPAGRNNASWTVTSTEGWRFTLPALTYSWAPSGDVVSPTSQSTLTNALTATEAFTVTASSGGCSATGNTTVTISAGAAITTGPAASAKCAGQTATFTVVATGPGLMYQWRKGGINIPIGGNASAGTATLSLANVSAADIATYDVVISSSCGSPVTSAGAALTVTTPLAGIGVNPSATICSGQSVTLTENGGTATSWSWSPGGAITQAITVSPTTNTTYTVTATVNSCPATASQTITVNPSPSAVTVTPATPTICAGSSVALTASGGTISGTATLGTGTSSTTAATTLSTLGPNPLQSYYGGSKQQMIVLASELTALGLVNGSAISSIAFNLSAAETGRTLQNLQVKISNTALSAFTSTTFAAAGTVVRTPANLSVTTGWNTIAFNSNFTWNGTSNLLIEVNFSNNDGGGTGTSTALYSTTAFASTLFFRVDTQTPAVIDATTTASFAAYTQRNNMQFGYTNPASFTWTPAASGLDVYTGPNVTALPANTTTYTATSTVGSCSAFNTALVTVNPNFTVTASAGANGNITPNGVTTLSCDGTGVITYTITPNACYSIANVIVDGVSQGAIDTYTFTNVTANHSISATFVLNTYTVTVTAGANGTVTPSTGSVNCGDNATYTITPNACYSIANVIVDGVSQGAVGTYTFTAVTANHSISATFVLNTYTVTVTAGANGTVTPSTGSVNCGNNATYTITPNACYSIANVIVDGVSQGAVGTYTFTNVTANHSISATFVLNTYTVTVTAGANGTVSPTGANQVNCGANATFTITPNACYSIADVIVDGVSQGAVEVYTFINVTANHTISATFSLNTYPITVTSGANGSITPSTGNVNCGTNATYTITPNACYSIADVIVDGVSQGAVGTYTFTNVTANHSISATFALNTYTITVTAGANGTITPSTGSVNCGNNATYTITPDACYSIANVIVDGVSQGAVGTYTFTNVTANHSISATFTLNTFTINVTSGANGTVSPTGTNQVNCGANATFIITPNACYSIADVIVDGVSQGAVEVYTFINVTGNHTISATFSLNTYPITVTSGANGSITPSTGNVNCGTTATYTITPNSNYAIDNVVVDGVSQGAVSSYTFNNVTASHTISATFIFNCVNVSIASATATTNPICSGNTTTLTANGVAGTNASVTWWTGSGGTGTQVGSGLTSNPVGAGTYYAYVTGDCGSPAQASVTVTVSNNTFTGTGNWTDNARWSCGAPPAPSDVITIAAGANVTLNTNFTVAGALTMTATSTLTVNPTRTFTVSGTANFAGQSVIFKSDASGTASLGKVTGALNNATNVTVERYIPNNGFRSWRLLSVPTYGSAQTIRQAWQEGLVNPNPQNNNLPGFGTQITGTGTYAAATAAGFDNTSGSAALLSWSGSAWAPVNSTNTAIANIKSYFLFLRGERSQVVGGGTNSSSATTLRTNGTVYTGNQASGNLPASSFNLIPNLYASAVNFTQLIRTGSVGNTFYIWDSKKQNGSSLGAYQTFSGTTGFATPLSGGSYGATNTTIESGQAFFVATDNSGTGTITLTEASKISGTNGSLGFRPATPAGALVKIDSRLISGGNVADGNVVVFNNVYSNAIDGDDALKLSNPGENFAIQKSTRTLAIEGRQMVTDADTLYFRIWNLRQQSYQFQFEPANLGTSGLAARLEDSYLHTSTTIDLNSINNISFTVDANAASSAANRFRIVFKQSAPLPVTFTSTSAIRTGMAVQVDWKVAAERNIRIYEVQRSNDGRNFSTAGTVAAKSSSAGETSYSFADAGAPLITVYYRIKIVGAAGDIKYTSIVKVIASDVKSGFAISPNPVEGSIINLQFINQTKGKYTVRLLGDAGQAIFTSIAAHAGGTSTQVLNLPSGIARGAYQVEIIAPDKTMTTRTVVLNRK